MRNPRNQEEDLESALYFKLPFPWILCTDELISSIVSRTESINIIEKKSVKFYFALTMFTLRVCWLYALHAFGKVLIIPKFTAVQSHKPSETNQHSRW